jgi:hypothetical protein
MDIRLIRDPAFFDQERKARLRQTDALGPPRIPAIGISHPLLNQGWKGSSLQIAAPN